MRTLDPGHIYELDHLGDDGFQTLTFIKRSGGAIQYGDEWPGLQTQEVLRALIDRTKYLYDVLPCKETEDAIWHLRMALFDYELRAWQRKMEGVNRKVPRHDDDYRVRLWRDELVEGVPFSEHCIELLATGRDGHVLPAMPDKMMRLPKLLRNRVMLAENGCWLYTDRWNSGNGYSKVRWEGRAWMVHRLLFTVLVGEIEEGLLLDHLCRYRPCCNPWHMEPVTVAENTRRGDAVLFGPAAVAGGGHPA